VFGALAAMVGIAEAKACIPGGCLGRHSSGDLSSLRMARWACISSSISRSIEERRKREAMRQGDSSVHLRRTHDGLNAFTVCSHARSVRASCLRPAGEGVELGAAVGLGEGPLRAYHWFCSMRCKRG